DDRGAVKRFGSFTFRIYRIYNNYVKNEFDPAKREKVLRERRLDMAEAGTLLATNCYEVCDERFEYGEMRWVSYGLLRGEVIACVWVDLNDDRVRVVTMRKANGNEQARYYRHVEGG
ncbi:MAG: BrnT family toxin, partial [Allosphingosinicella sp.]